MLKFADGIWLDTEPMRIMGMPLSVTMTALQLANNELLIYSPVAMTPQRRAAVEALGQVTHLYAPNLFHHRWIGEWAAAFPSAWVHGPAGLSKKRPDLRINRLHGETLKEVFSGVLEEFPIEGFRLRETALLYRPAQAMLVADLVQNVGRPTHPWTMTYTRLMGFYDQVALSRALRWTAFDDRRSARRSIDAILAQPFDRLIVGHGDPIPSNAKSALATAFGWLKG